MPRTPLSTIFRSIWTTGSKSQRQCPVSSGAELPDHGGKHLIFKRLALFLGIPVIIGLGIFNYLKKKKEVEEREPFHPYPHLRLRSKSFPWGDGQKSLFHNPRVNPLTDGYEDEVARQANESDE